MGVSGAVSQNQEYGLVLIHFPVRGATRHAEQQQRLQRISIRAPREGSDTLSLTPYPFTVEFQSTLPTRGATQAAGASYLLRRNFNPRSPRGERRCRSVKPMPVCCYFNPRSPRGERRCRRSHRPPAHSISIHAPREGSDMRCSCLCWIRSVFQSTLPARGATVAVDPSGR